MIELRKSVMPLRRKRSFLTRTVTKVQRNSGHTLIARTVQGMARVRSGQAPARPLSTR
jgi:hypothetical protein